MRSRIGSPKTTSVVACPSAPRQTELPRLAGDPCLAARNECRHRSEVVRVGRVPKAEQDRNEQDEPDRRPVGESRDPAVQHHSTPGSARVVMARPSTRISSSAHGGQRAHDPPLKVLLAEKAPRTDGREPDRGHRTGEAEAERDDEDEPIADPVQRDGREQDDQRSRAWEQAAGDPDCEEIPKAPVRVLVVMVVRVATPEAGARAHSLPRSTTRSAETRLSHG